MPDDANVIALPPRRRRGGLKGLPPDLPYTALGLDEHCLYVLDPSMILCRIGRHQISRSWIVGLFGEQQELLYRIYGRMRQTKEGEIPIPRSFHADRAADDLQRQCAACGKFDALAQLRGIGAWRGENDDLILHLGDRLWIPGPGAQKREVIAPLGRRGAHIYPRRVEAPPPFGLAVSPEPAKLLLAWLAAWRWQRAIDPKLLLGLIGSSFLAGALEHRPQLDITGEAGVGKTGLQQCVRQLLGPRMLLSSDASAAGIRQRIGCDALVVGLDEAESAADPRRIADLQLLRRASYGDAGDAIRGGIDHSPATFPLRSVFLASAITLAPMDPAMRSRTAVLTLLGPPDVEVSYAPARSECAMGIVGTQLLRRLTDQWRKLISETLPAWRALLGGHGFDGRSSATYGTLLACAHALLSDAVPSERDYQEHAGELEQFAAEDREDRVSSHERLLTFLFFQIIESLRRSGDRETLMSKVLAAGGHGRTPGSYARPEALAIVEARENEEAKEAQRELGQLGIAIVTSDTGARLLAFAVNSPWLETVLKDTPFAALRGRAEGHVRTLLRAPGARRMRVRFFGGSRSRAVALPLAYVLRGIVGPDPERTAEAWANIMTGDPIADES
jgi:hypothetical protein